MRRRLSIALLIAAFVVFGAFPASAQFAPILVNVYTNTTVTVTTTSADIPVPAGARTVALFLTVVGTVSGTTPTLSAQVKQKDAQGQAQYVNPGALVTTNCTATSCIQEIVYGPAFPTIANVSAPVILSTIVQVVLTAGGTTPSFGGTYVTLVFSF